MSGFGEERKKKEMENSDMRFELLVLKLKLTYYRGDDNIQHDICTAIESQMENLREREGVFVKNGTFKTR